jgi:hypothetical protein
MIKIESISIKEFRGIRDLTLDFNGKSFAVCGPNGTGKSGVVDALEFGLTGNVSRLSGEGRGDISVKQHGPHVDSRNAPDKARVIVKVSIPLFNLVVTIDRSVQTPTAPKITPNDPRAIIVLNLVQAHPEIALSRRELIRYVLATPGKRADEVQALLHLDQVERVRGVFQKISNASKKEHLVFNNATNDARTNLLRALDLTELTKSKLLVAANSQRAILELPPLIDVTKEFSFKDGLATQAAAQKPQIIKAQALEEIKNVREAIGEILGPDTITKISLAIVTLQGLMRDPLIASGIAREDFYKTGLALIEAESCPFCDTAWDPVKLRSLLKEKITGLEESARKRKAAEALLVPLISFLRKAKTAVDSIVQSAPRAKPPVPIDALTNYSTVCANAMNVLGAFLPLATALSALESYAIVPQALLDTIAEFEKVVKALPEPTKQDAAREWLTLAQERFEVWQEAKRKLEAAKERADRSRKVSELYASVSDAVLSGMYTEVEKEFAGLYAFVNRGDEDNFKAKLVPSLGKLGFDVDFYGRGSFPPGAYHSEGHQDSMGICLYLALMRHLQGSSFTLAVLDDVLMSVDANHRREVCALLNKEFPDTQFIVTTHDPIWLRHMKTEGLIGSRAGVQFRNWNVESGPTQWDDRDVWAEIEDDLNANDVRGAAGLLRNYLEFISAELCHRLRAPVEYRGDAQYQLGELMPAALAQMRKLFKEAKDAANSYGQKEIVEKIEAAKTGFGTTADKSKAEQWQTNTAIHFNYWDNLGKADFLPVVTAFRELLAQFSCPDCSSFVRVVPERETREGVRCDCGKINTNLKRKVG